MTSRDLFVAAALSVVLLSSLWLWKPRKFPAPELAVCATKTEALAALDLIKEWGTWLTGIQTAAIAGLALVIKRRTRAAVFATVAIAMFGASIIADTALLGNLPRMALRLSSPAHVVTCETCEPCPSIASNAPDRDSINIDSPEGPSPERLDRRYDVYEMTVSETSGIRLGFAYMLSHWYFIFGVVAFAAAFVVELTTRRASRRLHRPAR